MNPKISIITICYNSEKLIERTIKSVIQQDYNNYEYIIIDGLSCDGTMNIINKYKSHISAVISERDSGISDAFNKGVEHASGELICFLNTGDYFLNDNVLSVVANDWSKNKVDVLFYIMKVGENGYTPPKYYLDDEEKIWKNMDIPHQACFCRRGLFDEIGMFDLNLKLRMDYDFFARCVKQKKSYKYIPKVISYYDDNGVTSNPRNKLNFKLEGIKVKRKLGFKIYLREWLSLIKWKGLSILYR